MRPWLQAVTAATLVASVIAATTPLPEPLPTCEPAKACKPGVLLPVWTPQTNLTTTDTVFRATVYLLALLYLFVGVAIIADRFMAAIEVITSQEREVVLKNKVTGEPYTVLIRVWNETVSNLTLMALGSSAPEILLSIIEIFGNNFEAGDLGPSTIVGSAAFNFFIIIAICIVSIPNGQVRRIARNDVFWVTAIWGTFAYVWLFLILGVFSPNVVEVWEGVLTFAFFFVTVINAYIANRFFPKFGRRFLKSKNVTSFAKNNRLNNDIKLEGGAADVEEDQTDYLLEAERDPRIVAFEHHKRRFWEIFQSVRAEHPDLPIAEIGKLTAWQALAEAPKSRAIRRVSAIRKLTAGLPLLRKAEAATAEIVEPLVPAAEPKVVITFDPCHYICMENVGTVKLHVKVDRGSLTDPTRVTVSYKTIQDTATEGSDYEGVQGTLVFEPGTSKADIEVKIIDCQKYEIDEKFHVQLYNAHAVTAVVGESTSKDVPCTIGAASEATVIIVDDDHGGVFSFNSKVFKISENTGVFNLRVGRTRGARGAVSLPYSVINGSAKLDKDFELPGNGTLEFADGQTFAEIPIKIINDDTYEKNEDFFLSLGQPIWHVKDQDGENGADGRPALGAHVRAKIVINEDQEFRRFIDKLIAKANCSVMVGTSSWAQQFTESLTVGVDEEDCVDGAPHSASVLQKVIHGITLPWKLLFAFVPPTEYAGGWLCFVCSIVVIGMLTAVIGDVASMLGCTVGLKDSVTAITLVAMGTSLPDTFASKLAAVQDPTADASIGNVTGSNAVNVFLGIGVAWAIAAIVHASRGTVFRVNSAGLASSVGIFIIGSIVCLGVLQLRRYAGAVRGELGGPNAVRYISFAIFVSMWIIYLTYAIADAYCFI
uniref:Calx-beta domain-containing protein n=1 Tax=Panagrellus redivivus TaxID=6233 RepID=A0A7E4UVP9_PANRE